MSSQVIYNLFLFFFILELQLFAFFFFDNSFNTNRNSYIYTSWQSTITNNKESSSSTHPEFDFSKNQKDINQSMHENIIMALEFVKRIEGRLDGIEA